MRNVRVLAVAYELEQRSSALATARRECHEPRMTLAADRYYRSLAAAYARGRLGIDGDDEDVLAGALDAGLRLHRFKRNAELPRVHRVLGLLRSLAPSELLDVGSGRGTFLWPLLDAFPELRVTAIDENEERAAQLIATASAWDPLSAHRMDVSALAFDDASFDGVTALEILEHLADPAAAARQIVRVARRFVVASVPSHEDENPEHVQLFDPRSLTALLTNAGAARVKIESVRGHLVALASK